VISFEDWRERVTAIGPCDELNCATAAEGYTADGHLDYLWRRINNGDDPEQTVLWNTRPAQDLNLLHAVYLEKLKTLQEAGFGATIVIFDKYEQEAEQLSEGEADRLRTRSVDFAKKLLEAGLDEERTEILLETELRAACDPEDIVESIVTLGTADAVDGWEPEGSGEAERTSSADLIRNIIEIHYETVVDCDAILAGQADLEGVWRLLRDALDETDCFDGYTEPLVFGFPNLTGVDGEPLSPTDASNSIAASMPSERIFERLRRSASFRETVFEYYLLQSSGSVPLDGERIDSYAALADRCSKDRVAQSIVDHLPEPF
jgi:hypothetical protein